MPAASTSPGEVDATLERLLYHTLEVMCFAEAERIALPPEMDRAVEARVDFSGSCAGYLQLEIKPAAAHSLTAAFLGLEPSHPSLASQTGDTMNELARVLCGRLMTSLDPASAFETMPAAGGPCGPRETVRQAFCLPAGILRITLQIS